MSVAVPAEELVNEEPFVAYSKLPDVLVPVPVPHPKSVPVA
jgi:hypothetical protein